MYIVHAIQIHALLPSVRRSVTLTTIGGCPVSKDMKLMKNSNQIWLSCLMSVYTVYLHNLQGDKRNLSILYYIWRLTFS